VSQAREAKFDLSRKGDESWPSLFGGQWKQIFATAAVGGLEAATPQIRVLRVFCRGYMTQEESDFCDEQFEMGDFESLERVLDVLVNVAIRKGAWDYIEPRRVYKESVESLGRALQ
jgi:hypothetical protein